MSFHRKEENDESNSPKGVVAQRKAFTENSKIIHSMWKEKCNGELEFFAIDPAISATGWAFRSSDGNIKVGCVRPKGFGFYRYLEIEKLIRKKIKGKSPFCAIEGYAFASRFGREKAGELGGIIRRTLFINDRPLLAISPLSVKSWVRAGKKQNIMLEILDRYKIKISDDNSADAFLIQEIARCLVILVDHFMKQKIFDQEDVRLYFKDDEYRKVKALNGLFKYQANTIFNLVAKQGSSIRDFLKREKN